MPTISRFARRLDLSIDARLGVEADAEAALPGGESALAELAGSGAQARGHGLRAGRAALA